MIIAQIFLAARNFAISSKNPLCELKKNEMRDPKILGSNPFFIADSTYVIAFAKVKASSWVAVEPASLIW